MYNGSNELCILVVHLSSVVVVVVVRSLTDSKWSHHIYEPVSDQMEHMWVMKIKHQFTLLHLTTTTTRNCRIVPAHPIDTGDDDE